MRQMLPDGNCARRKCAPRRTLFHDTPVGREIRRKDSREAEGESRQTRREAFYEETKTLDGSGADVYGSAGWLRQQRRSRADGSGFHRRGSGRRNGGGGRERNRGRRVRRLRFGWRCGIIPIPSITRPCLKPLWRNSPIYHEPVEFSADEYDNVIVTQLSGNHRISTWYSPRIRRRCPR